jgi:hypothetical protein
MFVAKRRLRGKGHNPEKSVLGSSPGENVFSSSVTKHVRGKEPRTNWIVSAMRRDKTVLCSNPGEDVGFRNNKTFL